MTSVFIVILGCLIISLVVFGGAQVFIPYFKILLVNILNVPLETWNSILSIANATPGVFGVKLAMSAGYLAGNGYWWAFLLMLLTYSIFTIIPIIIMLSVMKQFNKFKSNQFMQSFLKIMKPIIAGILVSVIINLLTSITIPFIKFNELGNYIEIKNDEFFKNWRYWIMIVWSFISIPLDFYLIKKYKINIIYLVLINISLCMFLFQPWIN